MLLRKKKTKWKNNLVYRKKKTMPRISRDEHYVRQVINIGRERGTCTRRKVGCVLTNSRGQQLSTGYNGPPSKEPHCTDDPCPGASQLSGEGLSLCEAVHAEINALLQCPNIYEIETCYSTCSPCVDCTKALMNTSCQRIVFRFDYPHFDAKERWIKSGGTPATVRQWLKL